jgi:hypothetical protein
VKKDADVGWGNAGMLHRFIYTGVQTGLEGDVVNHLENVRLGYKNIGRDLRHASVESVENLLGFLSHFQVRMFFFN